MKSIEFRTNPMFLRNQFKGDGVFEIPQLKIDEIDLEEVELMLSENRTDAIVHFFMDDYKFEAVSGKGAWVNKKTGETLHPDLNHRELYGPHWDYNYPGGGNGFRIYPDGTMTPKMYEGEMIYA